MRMLVLITWYQNKVCGSRALLSFLDVNSVECVAIDVCTTQDKKRDIKDWRPSFLITIGCMELISHPESNIANTDSFRRW